MSKSKLAYDSVTGAVALLAVTDDDELMAQMLALNTPGGHAVVDATNIETIVDVVVDVTTATPIIKAPVAPVKTLAEAQQSKRSEIERSRDLASTANVTALGRQWQADERSQKLLGNAITLASSGLPLPTHWRDANNINFPVTSLTDLLAIAGAIADQTQAAYAKSWSKKA